MKQQLTVQAGDLIVQQKDNTWSAVKILAIDSWGPGILTAYCQIYRPVSTKPTIASLATTEVSIGLAPIDAWSFSEGWECIGNSVPSADELSCYLEHLKLTDFPRYASVTGQDIESIVHRANEHYKQGYALDDQGNKMEAITEYSRALELFPLYYEALDNRGLIHMELGNYREALQDFDQSLRIHPHGFEAFISRGKCFLKLDDLIAAEKVFREGMSAFHEHRETFRALLIHVHEL